MSARLELDIGQFMLDTMGFDPETLCAYVRLMVAYRANGPLNINALARIAGLDTMSWDCSEDLIAPLFELKDGHWHNAAIDEQIAKTGRLRKNAAKASAAAVLSKGGSPSPVKAPAFDADTTGSNPVPPAIDVSETDEEWFDIKGINPRAKRVPAPPPIEIGPRVQTTVIHMGAPLLIDEIGEEISSDWSLPPEEIVQCRGEGFSSVEIADVIDSFKRYHLAAGSLSTDWDASWRKWWERKKPAKTKAKPRVQVSRQPIEDADGTEA